MTEKEKQIRALAVEEDRANTIDSHLLRRLWAFLLPYRKLVLICLALTIGAAMLKLSQPVIIHYALDDQVPARDVSGIVKTSLLFFGVIVAGLALDILFNYLSNVVGQRCMHDLRMAIFRHVNKMDVVFFDRNPVGRLVTRMTSDVSALSDLFTTGAVAMLSEMLMLIGLFAVMAFYSVKLTLVVLCATPFMIAIVYLFRRYTRKWNLEARARLARINAYLQENIAGMSAVQTFNREDKNLGQFQRLNAQYRSSQIRTIMGFALFFPAINLLSYLTLTSVIWVEGRSVIEARLLGGGELRFATLLLFVQCVTMLFMPLRRLSEQYNILQAAMASSARIFRLLDTRAKITAPPNPRKLEHIREGIEFDRVNFAYVEDEPVLTDVSFRIPRGKTTAVVGATGSGKTTLINLMTRFYDVQSGRILIDGVDIREFDPNRLRRKFAVVLQDVFLFSDTVANNLRLTNPDLTDEEVWGLLREVRADDFVRRLPHGIHTKVTERASTFSTGQKQLLAFARALAANPEFLILDEATANVDTATEQRIQEAIHRLLEGRTSLVIAHRLSTIREADNILVMHKGRLHESGTHRELLETDGLYRRLYALQFPVEMASAPAT